MTSRAGAQNEISFEEPLGSKPEPAAQQKLKIAAGGNGLASISVTPGEAAPLDTSAWQVITLLPRLDGDNHADLMSEIHAVLAMGARRVALDLTQNRFFSLNAIQFCVSLARDLASDDGRLALIGCGERTKRHFEIYGSLKQITVVRSVNELVQDSMQAIVMRPRRGPSQELG